MIKHLRRLLVLLTLLVVPAVVMQATDRLKLCIELKTGEVETAMLTEQPVLTFDKDHLLVSTSTVSFSYDNIERAYIDSANGTLKPDDEPNAIDGVANDRPENGVSLSFAFDGRTLRLATHDELPSARVYGVGGRLVQPTQERGLHSVTIHMDELPQGVYIVAAGERSYKIVVK